MKLVSEQLRKEEQKGRSAADKARTATYISDKGAPRTRRPSGKLTFQTRQNVDQKPQFILFLQRTLNRSLTTSFWLGDRNSRMTPFKPSTYSSWTSKLTRAPSQTTESQFMCHHCGWIGDQSFFFHCSQRVVSVRSDPEEDLYKFLFNMRSGLSKVCDKKFCWYCVRVCYGGPAKKGEMKYWSCVFCSVSSSERMLLSIL